MSDGSPAAGGMLVVTIDRLPAWILPAYGCTWLALPAFTELAGRGLTIDRLVAGSDDPDVTCAALAGCGVGRERDWPLLTTAAAAGWSPAVVTDDEVLAASVPGSVPARHVAVSPGTDPADDESDTSLSRLFASATQHLSEAPCRFLWCHAASLGATWDAPPAYRDAYLDPDDPPPPPGAAVPELLLDDRVDPDLVVSLRHLFAGQLMLLDACLGRLLDAVAKRNGGRSWTILVAGVRGMPLGLHGRVGPGSLAPFSELIHLPAILVDHAGRMAAQRFGGLVTPVDIAATLIEQAGGRVPPGDDPRAGRSLTRLLEAWVHHDRDRGICSAAAGTAITTPAWHLVLPEVVGGEQPAPLLYARPDDFFEACDVADRCPDVATELSAIASLAATDPAAAWNAALSEAAIKGV